MMHRWTKGVGTAWGDAESDPFFCCITPSQVGGAADRWSLLAFTNLVENELATSILNESWSNCSDPPQISLHSFNWAVILKVKMIVLTLSCNCTPSDQRAFERKRDVGLCRSAWWPLSMTSLGYRRCAGFSCEGCRGEYSLLCPNLSFFLCLRTSLELLWVRWGALVGLFTVTCWNYQGSFRLFDSGDITSSGKQRFLHTSPAHVKRF